MHSVPGKLLLFGEYVVLKGGDALSMPLPAYSGHWTFDLPKESLKYAQGRLAELATDTRICSLDWLNMQGMRQDINQGIWIESNTPSGYGIGSSGVVTALIYDRYSLRVQTDIGRLRSELAAIESFFHGSSSGVDPLTSFTNRSLLVQQPNDHITLLESLPESQCHIYLLDSQSKRNTAQLVQAFKTQCAEQAGFEQAIIELKHISNHTLSAYLKQSPDFFALLKALSMRHLELFSGAFIPSHIEKVWRTGLDTYQYTMKLCGAGGGGFFLVFSVTELELQLGSFTLVKVQ
jgi:mevalonate kinase